MSIGNTLGALAAGIAIIGGTATGVTFYFDLVDRIEAVESQPGAAAPDLAPLQRQINALEAEIANRPASNGNSAALTRLAQEVADLNARIAVLEAAPVSSGGGVDAALLARLNSVEARLEAMGASTVDGARAVSGGGAGPAVIETSFTARVQGLEFRLGRCVGRSAPVCSYTIENPTNSDARVRIDVNNGQNNSHGYSQTSELVPANRIQIGPNSSSSWTAMVVPSGLRIEGEIQFSQATTPVEFFQILRIEFDDPGNQWVEFRNVAIAP